MTTILSIISTNSCPYNGSSIGVLAGREELVSFDRRHISFPPRSTPISYIRTQSTNTSEKDSISSENSRFFSGFGTCYGCLALATKHCISILKELAKNASHKVSLIELQVLKELCNTNLSIGTSSMQNDVRDLILSLNQHNLSAAEQLMDWLRHRLAYIIIHHHSHPNFGLAVHHEIRLLKSAMEYDDCFWEKRLRSVFIVKIHAYSVISCLSIPPVNDESRHLYT
ncbi:hypothetical protein LOD99_3082 [Oopsacas minuta]|uniref:Uncharacterized protein n=1 Tax=Oopsacas minuta TaxID=111878 RepID=A0AAV7K0Y2_9METZ|nr:hypothetical protein LOD99_3082 [Oopsacas minuta]